MKGYIKLHRQLQDHPLWKEKRKFSRAEAWIDLLMLANHKDSKIIVRGIVLDLKAGDLFWSQDELAIKWSWSKTKVRSFLDLLKKEGQISYKVDYRIGITSIVNWTKFQQENTTDQTTNNTTEKPQKNYRPGSNKNVKNVKNVKNIGKKFIKPTIEEIKSYCEERKNTVIAEKFFNYYESNGWKVGKNPMKSWQAAIRTWENNSYGQGTIRTNGAVQAEKNKYNGK